MPDKVKILCRDADESEFNLIRQTYLLSSRSRFPACFMGKDYYLDKRQSYIENLLQDENTRALVAYNHDNPIVVIGYILFTGEFIHYVYVKYVYRKYGLATSLIKKAIGDKAIIHTDHLPFNKGDIEKINESKIKWSCFEIIYKPYGI